MPWSNHRPGHNQRYNRDHRTTRAAHLAALRAAGSGQCAEPICIKRSRLITPAMDLHLSHTPDGVTVLGLSHAACNRHEAAVRARHIQEQRRHARPTHASRLRW